MYIDNNAMSIYMETDIQVTNCVAQYYGGVFYINKANIVKMTGNIYTTFNAYNEGSFLYSLATNLQLTVTSNTFTAITTPYVINTIWPVVVSGNGQRGGMFYISGATTPTISTTNTYQNNYVAFRGGSYSLYNTQLFETGSTFLYMAAINGGHVYCSSCSMTFSGSTFTYQRAYNGGVWYVLSYLITTPFTATNVAITDTKAYQLGGTGYLTGATTNTWTFTTVTVQTS